MSCGVVPAIPQKAENGSRSRANEQVESRTSDLTFLLPVCFVDD